MNGLFAALSLIALGVSQAGEPTERTTEEAEDEKYLCEADHATGFVYNEAGDEWLPTPFNVPGRRYLVAKSRVDGDDLDPLTPFEVTQIGDSRPSLFCPEGFYATTDLLVCDTGTFTPETPSGLSLAVVGDEFVFNRSNGRYQYYRRGSYYRPTGPPFIETFIEIGRCSAF